MSPALVWARMKTITRWMGLAVPGFLAAAAVAGAHPGHDGSDFTWDFQTGLAHPLSGLDHVLAMVAIGWWAYQLGGRARWAVPAIFLGVLALAGAVGQSAMPPGGVEQAVAASVLVMGILVATAARVPLIAAAALVGAFAVFHGLAHAAGMPASAGGLEYGLGFLTASAALNAFGIALGALTAKRTAAAQVLGAACVVAGLVLLAG